MMGRKRLLVVPGAGAEPRRDDAQDALAPFDADERGEWWWRQPKWTRRAWTLGAGGRAVASLAGESLFSNTSRVRFSEAAYEVHRGWLGTCELRDEGSPEARLRFVLRWSGGGRFEAPGSEAVQLVATGFWKRTLELRTADEHVLARLESHDAFTRHEVRVHLEDAARRRADLTLLLALSAAIALARKRHSH